MANLIEQLSVSQQGYQSHHSAPLQYHLKPAPIRHRRWPMMLSLLLMPPVVVLGWQAYSDYQAQREAWLANNQGQVEIVDRSAPLAILPYPQFLELAETTHHQFDVNDNMLVDDTFSSTESVESKVANQVSSPSNMEQSKQALDEQEMSEDDLLSGLDLSGLSPDIAQRLQAAMASPEAEVDVEQGIAAQALAENSRQWAGRLPPLNFQTHVYSSNEAKRWVKINGVEYKQGDRIGHDVALIAIEPQACVIDFQGEMIRVPALYDWQG